MYFVTAVFLFSACNSSKQTSNFQSGNTSALRPLTAEEKAADFDQLLQLFKTYYGPYKFKEERFNYSIEKTILDIKAQAMTAKTDEEFMGYVMQVSASFKDGHVQFLLENSASNISRYKIPVTLVTYENRAIVAAVTKDFSGWSGISQGDEILTVDGKAPQEILAQALKYRRAAQSLSDDALIVYTFLRPSYMTDIVPAKPTALIVFKTAAGKTSSIDAPWETEKYADSLAKMVRPPQGTINLSVPFVDDLNFMDAHRLQMGQVEPIFLTPQSHSTFKFIRVVPTPATMKTMGLKGDETPGIYAALYKYAGKTVFLLRSSTYYPQDYDGGVYMKYYKALIADFQDLSDVMVLDQMHNPGGSFCADFYNLFAKENDVQSVEQVRADRKWINDLYINWPKEEGPTSNPWDIKLLQTWGAIVEKHYDQGDFLTEPFALFAGSNYVILKEVTWTKPMIVLIDELAGSCGDMFPMLVKANKRAIMIGRKTMGLGGNVEEVGQLNHSRIHVSMTRGLFFPFHADGKYPTAEIVENNGVDPDIEYAHTVEDFRNGFTGYVKMFSDKAVDLVK